MQIDARRNFIWNMIASIATSIASMILLVFVTRINGIEDGGVFSIAFSTSQMMLTIGTFGMRTYQATDIDKKYTLGEYIGSRIISCVLMIVISIIYVLLLGYRGEKLYVTIGMCVFKMLDAIGDIFEGQFHQRGRLDLAGKSLFYRTFLSIIVFYLVLKMSHSLLMTTIVSCIFGVILIIFFYIQPTAKAYKGECRINVKKVKPLFIECMPLFICNFFIIYIYNVPKYSIDYYMNAEIQTYYNILFMPAAVINLFSGFIFRPMLTTLAINYNENLKKFKSIIIKLILGIGALTIVTVLGGITVGIRILSIISGLDLKDYNLQFALILVGGGFSSLVSLVFHIMTVIRKQYTLLIGYLLGAIIVTMSAPILVKKLGMLGATLGYINTMFLSSLIFLCMLVYCINDDSRKNG